MQAVILDHSRCSPHSAEVESTVIYTPSRELKSAQIAELIYQAECAARDKVLPSSLDFGGNVVVKPIEILEWAKEYGVEVHPEIERAITGRTIGALSVQTLGRPTDPMLEECGKAWRKATYDLMKEEGKITYVSAARWIYEAKENNIADGYAVETIRRELTNKKMAADKYDLTKIKRTKESRMFSYEHGKGW